MKFLGEKTDLEARFDAVGLIGDWQDKPNSVLRFLLKSKVGVNWSRTKGTIWIDGPNDEKPAVEALVQNALGVIAPVAKVDAVENSTVFVVHGHDTVAREQLELVLHKLGLDHFVLQNSDGGGLTIIESLEKMIGKDAQSTFGIVLMTPDDVGYPSATGAADAKPTGRDNRGTATDQPQKKGR